MSQNVSKRLTSATAAEAECPKVRHLTDRQRAAIELILTGASDTAIADALTVHRRTVYRWRVEDEQFRYELDRRRREVFDAANDRLRSMLLTALDRLDKQVKDRYDPTSHRAARTLLTLARVGQVVAAGDQGISRTPVSEVRRKPGSVPGNHPQNPPLRSTLEGASDAQSPVEVDRFPSGA